MCIHHVSGSSGGNGAGDAARGSNTQSPVGEASNATLGVAVRLPTLTKPGDLIGFSFGGDAKAEAEPEDEDRRLEAAE